MARANNYKEENKEKNQRTKKQASTQIKKWMKQYKVSNDQIIKETNKK